MKWWVLGAGLLPILACGGETGPRLPQQVALDFGTVLAGTTVDRGVTVSGLTADVDITGQTAAWNGFIDPDDEKLWVRFAPTRPGTFTATLTVERGRSSLPVRVKGHARAPEVTVFPPALDLSPLSPATAYDVLYVEVEGDVPYRVVSAECPGHLCVTPLSDGGTLLETVDPGAHPFVRVGVTPELTGAEPNLRTAAIVLETCEDEACRIAIPLRGDLGACVRRPRFVGRVAIGSEIRRRWPCLEAKSDADTDDFSVVTEGAGATVVFRPTAAGLRAIDVDTPGGPVTLWGFGARSDDCDLRFDRELINFGVVAVGVPATRTLAVTNLGRSDCLVSGVEVEGGVAQRPERLSAVLHPGASMTVPVTIDVGAPGRLTRSATVDFAGGAKTVALSAVGVAESLIVSPTALDFGAVLTCAGQSQPLTVTNLGTRGAVLTGSTRPEALRPFETSVSPLEDVPAGGTVRTQVTFRPRFVASEDGATFGRQLDLEFRLGDGEVFAAELFMTATASAAQPQVDVFQQLGRPKIDILLALPAEAALAPRADHTRAQLLDYLDFLKAQGLDVRVAVTRATGTRTAGFVPLGRADREYWTADDPANVTGWLPDTFTATRSVMLDGLVAALSVPNPDLSAFLRPDAVLSVLAISALADSSHEGVHVYTSSLLGIKGIRNSNLFSFSTVSGPSPDGCEVGAFVAQPAPRLLEVVQWTGGVHQSICTDDWARAIEDLSTVVFGFKSRFFLTNQPIEETLVVEVNGMIVEREDETGPVNWSYDFATNSINFAPRAVPEPDAVIEVEYLAECP